MSLFKFHDSNFLGGFNKPNVKAIADTYNGYQFNVTSDTQVIVPDLATAKLGDIYVMLNIIDKPEIINTDSYKVIADEYIRAFRLKDYVGQQFDMSADLATDAFADVAVGALLIPRSVADTTNTMKWTKTADASAYEIYLKVIKKTTFGAFTVDASGGTVAGGYVVEVMANDNL
jgi:hypothetical protein